MMPHPPPRLPPQSPHQSWALAPRGHPGQCFPLETFLFVVALSRGHIRRGSEPKSRWMV